MQREIVKELGVGERLLWTGQPVQGIRLTAADVFLVPFSFLWGGFAIFWEWGTLRSGAPLLFPLFGIPFVLLGLYIMVGRFIFSARRRSRTYYGLTDQRVIVVSGLSARQVKSVALRGLAQLSFIEGRRGRGTILFGEAPPFYSFLAETSWPSVDWRAPPAFVGIDDVRGIYDQVRQAQREATTRP